MSFSKSGLKQIVLCDSGTLLTTPTNALAVGLRNAATMERTPFKEVKDYRQRNLRNMVNFKTDWESLQPTMAMIKAYHNWINVNCDAQVLTVPQTSGGAGDCYQFAGNNQLGLGYELMITVDKRSLKGMLEGAMEFDRAKTLIDSADSVTPVTFSGITGDGADFTMYRAPYFVAFEAPKTTALVSAKDIIERSLSIKTKMKKSYYNMDIIDYVTVEFSITIRDGSVAKQIEIMAKDMSPTIYIKEMNSGAYFDAFDFAAGVLTLHDEFKDADDDRSLKLMFSGDVPVFDVDFQFGDTYGEDSSNTDGLVGGTMKIGY